MRNKTNMQQKRQKRNNTVLPGGHVWDNVVKLKLFNYCFDFISLAQEVSFHLIFEKTSLLHNSYKFHLGYHSKPLHQHTKNSLLRFPNEV